MRSRIEFAVRDDGTLRRAGSIDRAGDIAAADVDLGSCLGDVARVSSTRSPTGDTRVIARPLDLESSL